MLMFDVLHTITIVNEILRHCHSWLARQWCLFNCVLFVDYMLAEMKADGLENVHGENVTVS